MTFELKVMLGEATDCEARLYVEPRGEAFESSLSLRVTIGGPRCRFARTLPATIAFRQLPGEQRPLAAATIPDPCFWSPELPFLYTIRGELRRGDELVRVVEQTIGLRRFGAQGPHLLLNGRRIVLRGGVAADGGATANLSCCRDTSTALIIDWPGDDVCWEAAETGVLLVARLAASRLAEEASSRVDIAAAIARLARCPAVIGVVVPPHVYHHEHVAPSGGRPLMGVYLTATECDPADIPSAAELVCLCGESLGQLQTAVSAVTSRVDVPVMAVHVPPSALEAAAARRGAAERLQQSLNACGDLAGYFAG